MNAARRKELDRALALMVEAIEIITACADEERVYYDAMPEGIQNSDRGERASEAADALEDAASQLEEASNAIEGARDA